MANKSYVDKTTNHIWEEFAQKMVDPVHLNSCSDVARQIFEITRALHSQGCEVLTDESYWKLETGIAVSETDGLTRSTKLVGMIDSKVTSGKTEIYPTWFDHFSREILFKTYLSATYHVSVGLIFFHLTQAWQWNGKACQPSRLVDI